MQRGSERIIIRQPSGATRVQERREQQGETYILLRPGVGDFWEAVIVGTREKILPHCDKDDNANAPRIDRWRMREELYTRDERQPGYQMARGDLCGRGRSVAIGG